MEITPNKAYRNYLSAAGDEPQKLSFKDWLQKQKDSGALSTILGTAAVLTAGGGGAGGQNTPPDQNTPPGSPPNATPEPMRIWGMKMGLFIPLALVTVSLIGVGIWAITKKKK